MRPAPPCWVSPRLLVDDSYRSRLLSTCGDPVIRAFWLREFADYHDRFVTEAVSPIQNKIGALLSPPALRNIIGQTHSTIDIPGIMNGGRVLIVNLSKGRLGEGPAHLLGAFLATAFAQAAESRAEIREADRRDFTLYADEFQNFATDSFASILSEARKWRLNLALAHQFLGQLPRLAIGVLRDMGVDAGAAHFFDGPHANCSVPNFLDDGIVTSRPTPTSTVGS